MARIIQETLGDMVFTIPKDAENYRAYPSPNQLKDKVIIKGKGKVTDCLDLIFGKDRDQ